MKNLTKLFVSIFFVGYIKFASGTWGSLLSLLIMYILFNVLALSLTVLTLMILNAFV